MTVWLRPEDVADRLGVTRRKALELMYTMPYTVISGTEKKRIRVSEQSLEAWMIKRTTGCIVCPKTATGTKRRLERR